VGLVTRVLAGNDQFVFTAPDRLWLLLGLVIYGNIVLGIFNFLPVPPLDGSVVLLSFLPRATRWRLEPVFASYGMLLLLPVFLLGGYVIGPVADAAFHALVGY
jgi:Zn-dependent protease